MLVDLPSGQMMSMHKLLFLILNHFNNRMSDSILLSKFSGSAMTTTIMKHVDGMVEPVVEMMS